MRSAGYPSERAGLPRLLACALLAAALAAGCSTSGARPRADSGKNPPGPTLDKMTARIYKGEDLQSIVRAQHALFNLNTSEAVLNAVKVSFYDKGKLTGDVTSDRGVMFLKEEPAKHVDKHDVLLTGRVEYRGQNAMTIKTPQLRYYSRSGKLVSQGGSFEQRMPLKDGLFLCTGRSFETTKDLNRFTNYGARLKVVVTQPSPERKQEQ